jgi:putative PIN family toxin of toxin-antitoxin system
LRAVLDPNVLIAAVISRSGTPALVLRAWHEGRFELVVSKALLRELERALRHPKLEAHVSAEQRSGYIELLRTTATQAEDPADVAPICDDPGDDYLIALAQAQRALLVAGDRHLLALAKRLPIMSPRAFLDTLPD